MVGRQLIGLFSADMPGEHPVFAPFNARDIDAPALHEVTR